MRIRHFKVSVAALAVCLSFAAEGAAQQMTVQTLLERGAFSEAVQRAEGERDNPESTYLAAQAAGRMDDTGRAVAEYNRLRETGDERKRANHTPMAAVKTLVAQTKRTWREKWNDPGAAAPPRSCRTPVTTCPTPRFP